MKWFGQSGSGRWRPTRKLYQAAFRWAVLAAPILPLHGCSRPPAVAEAARPEQTAAVPVTVATAVRKDVPVKLTAIARVEPYATVTVKPQVSGQLVEVHFQEGQDVRAGDLLFRLDARPYEAAVRQAEANLERDRALALDAAAEAAWKAGLLRQNAASQREYEQSQATADSRRATVEADEALLEKARLDLEYCTIRAPIDGRTGDNLADPGNVVKANETALVVINQINPIYVAFAVPEQFLLRIQEAQKGGPLVVEAFFPHDPGPPERGVLTFVDNKVDSATGTILLKGTFANAERRLWPGQFVNAELTLATRVGALVIPAPAVQTGQRGQYVFVVRDDLTVESRPVRVAFTLDTETVIDDGLRPGERVVTDGQLRLVPGARVEPHPAPTASPATSPATQPDYPS